VERKTLNRWIVGGATLLLVGSGFVGGYWGRGWLTTAGNSDARAWQQLLAQRQLLASTAATGETFSMATGSIDSDVDGLYILDYLTGELQCIVLNYRTGQFNAVFRANVQADLGVDPAKRPKYLMKTGMINFPRGASAARPGNSVVYVLDTTTGNFAAYAIPWRRELAATGRPQAAALMLMDVGKARTAALRE